MCEKRIAKFVVSLCVLLGATLFTVPIVASADRGLDVTSSYTYTIDPDADTVRVNADLSFTNTVPNRTEGDYINKTYFTGFSLPVPIDAVNVVAVQDGATLGTTVEPLDDTTSYVLLKIDFAARLFYQRTANVVVTYDIAGQAPRSEDPSRVNDAYAAFNAFGIADAGKLTLRVVVPGGYVIDTFGDTAERTEENGAIVYTASEVDQPDNFNLFISARNDAALTRTEVMLADKPFVIRSWPGDTGWDEFVRQQISAAVPALETLLGEPWPVEGALEVREAFTPYLYGYAGWFNNDTNELEVGEDLDAQVVVHELSHAWFNESWFFDRWINEGMAQTYSALVNTELGLAPENPDAINPADEARVQLNSWGNPLLTEGADEIEDYGYNASWFIVDSIVDEIGQEAMRNVFDSMQNATLAYVGDAPPEPTSPRTDWRRFLDLAERIGGSSTAADLIQTYAVDAEQSSIFSLRNQAIEAYDALADHGTGWAPPLAIRRAMALWDFTTARQLIAQAEGLLVSRNNLIGEAAALGLVVPAEVEAKYENSDRGFEEVERSIAKQTAAAKAVNAATVRFAQPPSLIDKVGLIGTEVQPILDESRVAFNSGNTDLAMAKSAQVIMTLDGRDQVGKSRLLRTGLAIGGFLALVVLLLVSRRRRGRKKRARREQADQLQQDQLQQDQLQEAELQQAQLSPPQWPAPAEPPVSQDSAGLFADLRD